MIASIFIPVFVTAEVAAYLPENARIRAAMVLKAAGSEIDYPITWVLEAGETIAASSWSVTPAGTLTVKAGSSIVAGPVTACLVKGGTFRRVYELTNTIVTSAGRVQAETVTVRIGAVSG